PPKLCEMQDVVEMRKAGVRRRPQGAAASRAYRVMQPSKAGGRPSLRTAGLARGSRFRAAGAAQGVAPQTDGSEIAAQSVIEQQAAREAVAEAEQFLDHLERLQAAHDAAQRAEHAGFRTGRNAARRRRCG